MNKPITAIKKIFYPPKPVLFIAPPLVFTALIYIFAAGKNDSMTAYFIYALSAYCLTILILPLPYLIRRARAAAVAKISGNPFGKNFLGDLAFKGKVSIQLSVLVNFLYVIFRVFLGIRYTSVWFISMAAYYLVLGIMRLYLAVNYSRREKNDERRCYRRTAFLLFLLNIPMGGMIALMVLTDSGYSYPGYIIYISAMYTFYIAAVSVINLIKFRRLGSPILSAAKTLNFISALMSIIGLQTAMLTEFSSKGEGYRKMMNGITGGCIWVIVILIALYMIQHSRKLKKQGEAS